MADGMQARRQAHYPGFYWSHVIYEGRLELGCLLLGPVSPLQQLAGHDHALDPVGASVDLGDRGQQAVSAGQRLVERRGISTDSARPVQDDHRVVTWVGLFPGEGPRGWYLRSRLSPGSRVPRVSRVSRACPGGGAVV